MECIILAGGLGTRLKEVVPHLPKPLAHINGSPFLDILLRHLASEQILTQAILAIGYKADDIMHHYTRHAAPLPVAFSVESTPLGTGGALAHALSLTKGEEVLVLNGDSFLLFSVSHLMKYHKECKSDITLVCKEMEECERYGRVVFDSDNKILSFEEKQACQGKGWISCGVYIIKRELLEKGAFKGSFSLEKEVFPSLLKKRMMAYPCDGFFIDIGTKESYNAAQELLK